MKRKKYLLALAVLAAVFLMMDGAASYAAPGLEENEEIQGVMGDLSALKTAAQMYYSDNGNNQLVPQLPSVLQYFDEDSLPVNAPSRYALRGDDEGWYVGHSAHGLTSGTYRQLEENASYLGLVGDDLRSPWRRDSAYIWSGALAFDPSGATVIREANNYDTAIGVAAILVGAAVFLSIIDRDHGHHYYCHPGQPWRWHSSLVYRPIYRDRFYRRFSQPALRSARPVPSPRREPPRLAPPRQAPHPSRQVSSPPRQAPNHQVSSPPRQAPNHQVSNSPRQAPSPSRQVSPPARREPSRQVAPPPPPRRDSRNDAPRPPARTPEQNRRPGNDRSSNDRSSSRRR